MSSLSWTEYFDAVEAAALDVRESLLEGRSPVLPTLALPAGAPDPADEDRRAEVADLVAEVTELLERHQQDVLDKLGSLPSVTSRAHGNHGYASRSEGESFDLRS